MSNPEKTNSTVSRRQALKTIAAITGAATLTQLPTKWASPLLTAGVLPAHAQTSPPINNVVINNLQGVPSNANRAQGIPTTYLVDFSFTYNDSAEALLPGSLLNAQFSSVPAGILPTELVNFTEYTLDGNGSTGTLTFTVEFDIEQIDAIPDSITAAVQITNTIGITSNSLAGTFTDLIPQPPVVLEISNLVATVPLGTPQGVTNPVEFSFNYDDSAGALLPGSLLNAQFSSVPAGILPTELVDFTEYTLAGNGATGTLTFTVDFDIEQIDAIPDSITATVQITNTIGITSNSLSDTFTDLIPQLPIVLEISDLVATVPLDAPQGFTNPVEFSFDYDDSTANLFPTSLLNAQFSSVPTGILPTELVTTTDYVLDGDNFSGKLTFFVEFDPEPLKGIPDSITVSVQLTNTNSFVSNILEETYTNLFPQ